MLFRSPTFMGDATPAWLIKVSEAVHYYEAWLATLAIFVWHLFFTIFHPDDYPLNSVMFFSGKMSQKAWRHKHEAFYLQLEAELERYRRKELDWHDLSPFAREALRELQAASKERTS